MSLCENLVRAVEQATGKQGRRSGHNTRLLCPAHDDHNPSLDIAEGKDGSPLVQCRSCGAGLTEVCAALGRPTGDFLPERGQEEEWTPQGPATAIYDYVDEDGKLLFQVCRTANKQFPQRRPDPTAQSGWRWNLKDTRRVLYRLPEVLAAAGTGRTVYVTEGEKDADAICGLGLCATCNPGGAGKWRSEYAEPLKGALVTVIADNDEVGLVHAKTVAASLNGTTRIVTPKEGKDATDHLNAGHTLDELQPLPDTRFRLTVTTASQLAALPDPPDSDLLLGPLILRGGRTIIVGDTGHGKTTLALQMAAAVLTGDHMLGYDGIGKGPILMLDLEQGLRSIKRSIIEAGLDQHDQALYISQPDGLALGDDADHIAELDRVIQEHMPTVLILDPFYKAHRGDANEEQPIVELMRLLDGLRAKYGFSLLLPAHPRKESTSSSGLRKLTIHDVAGSAAITRGAEVVLGLERISHGYARLRHLKDRDGDLPVGEAWPLIFTRGIGFRLDPKEETKVEDLETMIRNDHNDWRTAKEWGKSLGIREAKAKEILERLHESGDVLYALGPPGRSNRARCYMTAPINGAQSGAVPLQLAETTTAPTAPTSIEDVALGAVGGTAPNPGSVTTDEPEPDIDFDPDDELPF